MDLLEENENLEDIIFREREYEYHREDVRAEIQYLNEERKENNEELYEISDETIEEITDKYEDVLGDSEEWHFILKEVLRDFGVK